jgi:excinuclease ABC subunit C
MSFRLIMVDGGLGQVNACAALLEALGVEIRSSASQRDEELYLPGGASRSCFPRSDALRLLQASRRDPIRVERNQRLRTKEISRCLRVLRDGAAEGCAPVKAF